MAGGSDVYLFELDGRYLFKRYFAETDVFDTLREHYVRDAYRFEVPGDALDAVGETLRDHGYEPTIVDDPARFCVVIDQYESHAEILKRSVANWTRRDHRFFLMPDPAAVEEAIEQGAVPVAESPFEAGI